MCVLLAALDDDAFKAVDSLALSDAVLADYSELKTAMKNRFSPTTSPFELRFNLRRRRQKDGETFDNFAEELSRLAIKAYPELVAKTRQEVTRDQFIEGLRDEYIQERLLQVAPKDIDAALELAKRLGSAKAAQRSLKESSEPTKPTTINNISEGFDIKQEVRRSVQEALKDYLPSSQSPDDSTDVPVGAVTSAQYRQPQLPRRSPIRRGQSNRRQPLICWACGSPGHIRARCPNRDKPAELCSGCSGRGHSQQECPTWLRQQNRGGNGATCGATVSSSTTEHDLHSGIFVGLQVEGQMVDYLVDTGSAISLINRSLLQKNWN